MTIYIDIILIENIIMNYIIILTTGIICKKKIKQFRYILASIIGSIYAVISYMLNIKICNSEILKLLLAICMVYISFDAKNLKTLMKQLLIFFLTSFCFGGIAYYLLYSEIIKERNYNSSSLIKSVILGGIIGFIILNISFEIFKKKITQKDLIYNMEINYKNKSKKIKVLLDTGNLLKDPITNIPVVIVEKEKLKGILPEKILKNNNNLLKEIDNLEIDIKSRCNIIPFNSIGNHNGIIMGFRPDYITVYEDNNKIIKKVIIGICNERISKSDTYSGLIGLNILEDYAKSG